MLILVTGGSGSGKSAFAESVVMGLKTRPNLYIATMYPFDEECHRRIARHRLMRRDKGFATLECYTGLEAVTIPQGSAVLLECVSNLTANEMYDPSGAGEDTVRAVVRGILNLKRQADPLIVVTNEVFSDGITYDDSTMQYLHYLGEINQQLAAHAERVTEVVYGIPVALA